MSSWPKFKSSLRKDDQDQFSKLLVEIRRMSARIGALERIEGTLERLERYVCDTLARKPVDLKEVLWNQLAEPYSTKERRWQWIERATSTFRAQREVFPISSDLVMCRVLARYWMTFPGDGGLIPGRLMTEAWWELGLTETIAHACKPGMIAVDIGANIGYYSMLMADYAGPTGRVYACEPVPYLQDLLTRNFELNWLDDGRARIIKSPLASVSGRTVDFLIPSTDSKNARIVTNSEFSGQVIRLSTTTLDESLCEEGSVDLIKVDAEGAEMDIWLGMADVLARSPNVIVLLEFNASRVYDAAEFLTLIEHDGFRLAELDDFCGVRPVTKESLLQERVGHDRLLYLKR